MSKKNTPKRRSPKRSPNELEASIAALATTDPADTKQPSVIVWSTTRRRLASLGIVAYLIVLMMGPMSNPISSPYFSAPIAAAVSPIQRALFLGHGYRFFAPDPGNSHLLLYRGVRTDGSEFSGHFPSRDDHWPRLLYHRWFMLSETMFNEHMVRPTTEQYRQREVEYEREVLRLRTEGKRKLLTQLLEERQREARYFETTTARGDLLASRIAQVLMERNEGQSIEIFVQERRIPYPEEVADGLALNDDSLLSPPQKIGELDADGYRAIESVEKLPSQESIQ